MRDHDSMRRPENNNGWVFFESHNTPETLVGGSENRIESPNTRFANKILKSYEKETKNLQKPILALRALAPHFIGRRKDFLHPENTLKSREYS
jgi:hypothetical protein